MKSYLKFKKIFDRDTAAAPEIPEQGREIIADPCDFYSAGFFRKMLELERKRCERSGKPFLLVLIDVDHLLREGNKREAGRRICAALGGATREIDIKGWHRRNSIIGIIYVETNVSQKNAIEQKLKTGFGRYFSARAVDSLVLSFRIFPDDLSGENMKTLNEESLFYPRNDPESVPAKISLFMKRTIDILGSLCGIVLLSPLLLAVAMLIKCTSAGPVLFVQTRLGKHGKPFALLKFRSMNVGSNENIHKEFATKFIKESSQWARNGERTVYKLQNDPRITPVGRILRKTSLDELPQLFNVLLGDMSLVGPRPSIMYELEAYDIWHRRRVLEIKPGITGLWQVEGRSRTTFENMVRMDIRYIQHRSLWLDVKLILKTAIIVLLARGAL